MHAGDQGALTLHVCRPGPPASTLAQREKRLSSWAPLVAELDLGAHHTSLNALLDRR